MYLCNFFQNLSDFCIGSEGKLVKFSVKSAQDSPGKKAICNGKFGNIKMKLRSIVEETTK